MTNLPSQQPACRFTSIDSSLAQKLERRFGSPIYLFDIAGMLKWFDQFRGAAESVYPNVNIAVSVKTNPLFGLLSRLHERAAYAEIISGDEYQIAKHCGFSADSIVFNGPAKRDSELRSALLSGCRIHCDHHDEIDRIEAIAREEQIIACIGIRVYCERPGNFNRFGFSYSQDIDQSEAIHAVEKITRSAHLTFGGLHSHIGTNLREMDRFRQLGQDLCNIAMHIRKRFDFDLRWVDVGGGLAGISPSNSEANDVFAFPIPSPVEYVHAVLTPLMPFLNTSSMETRVIFEPGRALFDPWGGMLTTVVGRRPANSTSCKAVILDAGITSLALAEKFNHPLHVCKESTSIPGPTRFLGPTCMQRDEVHREQIVVDLERGDQMILYGVGGYSMTLASSFVNFRAGVVGWDDDFFWLRRPETIADKLSLESTNQSASFSNSD